MSSYSEAAYRRAKVSARRRPTIWLRRTEQRIVARLSAQPRYPDAGELARLAAIRSVLKIRRVRPCWRWRP